MARDQTSPLPRRLRRGVLVPTTGVRGLQVVGCQQRGHDLACGETVPKREIANQIAGNLKALLPSPSFLALPTISDGVDNVLEVLGSRVIEKFELQVAEHELTVVLVMRSISLLPVPWHS